MSTKSFIRQSLFVLLFCTSFLSAQAFLTLQEKGGFRWWDGVKGYPHPPTQKELSDEAVKAMESIPKAKRPGMVSALWTSDNKIYFATSRRVGAQVPVKERLVLDNRVSQALEACLDSLKNPKKPRHVFFGKCSEVMVIGEWYRMPGHTDLPKSGKLIVAVDGKLHVRNPCSIVHPTVSKKKKGSRIGCYDFLTKLGFAENEIVMSTDEEPAKLASCEMRRHGFGGLTERGCVPKKPTAKPSPRRKPAPKNQKPLRGKPKPPSNNRPKPVKPKAPSKKGPKH